MALAVFSCFMLLPILIVCSGSSILEPQRTSGGGAVEGNSPSLSNHFIRLRRQGKTRSVALPVTEGTPPRGAETRNSGRRAFASDAQQLDRDPSQQPTRPSSMSKAFSTASVEGNRHRFSSVSLSTRERDDEDTTTTRAPIGGDKDVKNEHRRHLRFTELHDRIHRHHHQRGLKPLSDMTDDEIYQEAANVEERRQGHYSLLRQHRVVTIANQIARRRNHFAAGGDEETAPVVERPPYVGPPEPEAAPFDSSTPKMNIDNGQAASVVTAGATPDSVVHTVTTTGDDDSSSGPAETPRVVVPDTHNRQITSKIPRKSQKILGEKERRRRIRNILSQRASKDGSAATVDASENIFLEQMDFHHRSDPSRCFAAAATFCPGLTSAYAEFIACAVLNRTLFKKHDAHCLVDLVEYHESCAGDMLYYCPRMASHETLQCLADLADRIEILRAQREGDAIVVRPEEDVQAANNPGPHATAHDDYLVAKGLSPECAASEFLEIIRQSQHIRRADRPVTEREKEIIRKHQDRHLRRQPSHTPEHSGGRYDDLGYLGGDQPETASPSSRDSASMGDEGPPAANGDLLEDDDASWIDALDAADVSAGGGAPHGGSHAAAKETTDEEAVVTIDPSDRDF